jgi:hypothetical protein
MLSAWCLPLTRGEDLPALVIALAPLPEHNLCAVVEVGVELVAVLDIEVEVDIVHHAHAAESLAHVQASPSTAPTRPATPGCTTKASLDCRDSLHRKQKNSYREHVIQAKMQSRRR